MSQMVRHKVSVLIGAVPLFAVNRITLNETYELPPVGDKGLSQSTGKINRSVQIEAALIGPERHLVRLGLEAMADLSKTLPALSSLVSGIPMVAGLTTLLDMQINSLSFSQSADEKDVFTASIALKHCPRPGLMALLSEATNAATAVVGVAAGLSGGSSPRPIVKAAAVASGSASLSASASVRTK
ncbi:MAG TPA: hypothetical protein VG406_13755 [Isosphaeraceae bacterium]|jgi:hypothetical protein|nr:hypothetical protein [Isosphaeraceae bacterium]